MPSICITQPYNSINNLVAMDWGEHTRLHKRLIKENKSV